MQIKESVLLAPYTTFKIGGPAKFFCLVKDQFDALQAYEFAAKHQLNTLVLGGGSNMLISDKGFDGLVMKIENSGIEILSQDQDQLSLRVASGENWDGVVKFAVKNNWWGMENLSHIPGSTGAIAVQNVGAYGQEAKNVIDSVVVFNKETHEIQSLKKENCGFAYRSSIFNRSQRGKHIIFYINFKLSKTPKPFLSYRDLREYFNSQGTTLSVPASPGHLPQMGESNNVLSLTQIREAIISIRDKKFPFPTEAKKGNAGSFFKNPILNSDEFEKLKQTIDVNFGTDKSVELEKKKFSSSSLPLPLGEGRGEGSQEIKVPAAFLMELCGLKDLKSGGAAINHNQPLVIINETGMARGSDVLSLANQVKLGVKLKTGIELQFEPELIGFE